jgi:hypothetical protein
MMNKGDRMRRQVMIVSLLAGLGLGCQASEAQQAPERQQASEGQEQQQQQQPVAEAAAGSSVDEVLAGLQRSGQDLRDFTAEVRMEELDNMTGAPKTRTGTVWYDRKEHGSVRLRLTLDKLIDDRGTISRKIEYLLKDGWLTDRDYSSKVEVARQVLRPGEKIDLLKLGEGPFPLPIGQDPAEVKRQFEVKQVPVEQEVPEDQLDRVKGTTRLQLTPREGSQFKEDFASIDVWVDPQTHFPQRIMTTSEANIQTTDLANLKVNSGIADQQFVLEDISQNGWNQRTEPFER